MIRGCFLRDYATHPERVDSSDVDIIVYPWDFGRIPGIINDLLGLRVPRYRKHEGGASVSYDVLSHDATGTPVLLGVDVTYEVRNLGAVLFAADEFLSRRTQFKSHF